MGNASESNDIANSDLVIKVVIPEDKTNKFRRVNDDLFIDLELSLSEAIFGCKKEVETIDKKIEIIEISPGTKQDDKIILDNQVRTNY